MSKQNIHIFSTHYAPETTGNAPYVTRLAEGLARKGYVVKVTCGAPHYPDWKIRPSSEWASEESAHGVTVSRVSSYVPRKPNFANRVLYEIGFGLKLARKLDRTVDVCLLVSPSLFGSIIVRLSGLLIRSRSQWMLWVQDLYSAGIRETPGLSGRMSAGLITRAERWLAHSVDRVIVIHDSFKATSIRSWGLTPERISVIRNWTHVSPSPQSRLEARSQMEWPREAVVVVHAGNQGAKQELQHVVRAARHASERQLPLLFLLVGDGNQRSELERSSAGLQNIQFLSPQPDDQFMGLLAAADVLLVNERPSLREAAVPSKLTTYFATGRPILAATDINSATADEVRRSGAGVVVSPEDPIGLCRAALQLSGERGSTLGDHGPQYVRQQLSEKAALLAFESLLTQHHVLDDRHTIAADPQSFQGRHVA